MPKKIAAFGFVVLATALAWFGSTSLTHDAPIAVDASMPADLLGSGSLALPVSDAYDAH